MPRELIVLVNDKGEPIGTADKLTAHNANTPLHLAFSCYVFNDQGELLVTQRAQSKKVWPGVWSNSVCGHPAPDEAMEDAIKRRLGYELGMKAKGFEVVLPNFRYKTPPFKGIIENEICPVYVARATSTPQPNPSEVAAIRWMSWSHYITAAKADKTDAYSYWCKDQLKQLEKHPEILKYAKMVAVA